MLSLDSGVGAPRGEMTSMPNLFQPVWVILRGGGRRADGEVWGLFGNSFTPFYTVRVKCEVKLSRQQLLSFFQTSQNSQVWFTGYYYFTFTPNEEAKETLRQKHWMHHGTKVKQYALSSRFSFPLFSPRDDLHLAQRHPKSRECQMDFPQCSLDGVCAKHCLPETNQLWVAVPQRALLFHKRAQLCKPSHGGTLRQS